MTDYRHLANAFHARDLAVPMQLAFSLPEDMPAGMAAEALRLRKYDQAPVLRGTDLVGFVLTRRLEGHASGIVRDATVPLGPPNIVSADARVADLLDWIADPGFLFVLDGRELMGFVTVSDFNKQPCRAYLYLLLATFEIAIADHLRRRCAPHQQELFGLIGTSARHARRRYNADVVADLDADPVSYLGFPQLLAAVGLDADGLAITGLGSRLDWEAESKTLSNLRNSVMHPTRSLLNEKAGLLRLRAHRDRLIELAGRFQT